MRLLFAVCMGMLLVGCAIKPQSTEKIDTQRVFVENNSDTPIAIVPSNQIAQGKVLLTPKTDTLIGPHGRAWVLLHDPLTPEQVVQVAAGHFDIAYRVTSSMDTWKSRSKVNGSTITITIDTIENSSELPPDPPQF